jgi:DNA repair exonuclease SbcCD ATPase subunit
MRPRSFSLGLCVVGGLVAGCTSQRDRARADSVQAIVVQQGQLMDKLTAQRDSVSTLLGEADTYIGKIDSSISRAKGLPARSRAAKGSEGPLEEQVRQRKDMLKRVDALVARARATAQEVAQLKEREKALLAENGDLKDSLSAAAQRIALDAQHIAELTGTIEQQAQAIAALQAKLDDFDKMLVSERTAASRAYYVIGTEDELIKKGLVVKEGGANLLIKRVGRTLVPARELDKTAFTPIDTRQVHEIEVPDTTKKYQIVSRQSLDDVRVASREGTSFRGSLEIPDAEKFWSASRYLIIVQK